ncbi:unnamed protein product, partial [Ilex paraguariensis]
VSVREREKEESMASMVIPSFSHSYLNLHFPVTRQKGCLTTMTRRRRRRMSSLLMTTRSSLSDNSGLLQAAKHT